MTDAHFRIWSSIGKKLLSGLTGVALAGFIVVHVVGNLTLFVGKDAFNAYTHALQGLGFLLVVVEVGLLTVFAVHALTGISVWLDKRNARSVHNVMVETKGAPSRQTFSSRTMIWTGAILLVFTVLHLVHFRFGPAESEGYVTILGGEEIRDLHRLVIEEFKNLLFVAGYMAVMILLGFHLRHGIWSAFQSLGALTPRLRPVMYSVGLVAGVAIAFAFFVMPIYIYLLVPEAGTSGLAMVP